jgi:hypothetical protein
MDKTKISFKDEMKSLADIVSGERLLREKEEKEEERKALAKEEEKRREKGRLLTERVSFRRKMILKRKKLYRILRNLNGSLQILLR